jgi:hypothetical protein
MENKTKIRGKRALGEQLSNQHITFFKVCFPFETTCVSLRDHGRAQNCRKSDKLFVVTHTGMLACLDVSDVAIEGSRVGDLKRTSTGRLKEIAVSAQEVKEAASEEGGVVVECVRVGKELRVHVVSPGYHQDWFCQFPRDIREEGAKYVVDQVREASQGGFYRVLGNIRRLKKA